MIAVRHGTVIPRPIDRYSGIFPPALAQQTVRAPLGWALDLTRFQWWERSSFSRCTPSPRRTDREPSPNPSLVTPAPQTAAAGGVVADRELRVEPERDAGAALLIAVVAWAGEASMQVSPTILARAAAAQGESLEAIAERLSAAGHPLLEQAWSWQDLRPPHDSRWSIIRSLAREVLILDLAGRRTVTPEERTLLDALLAPADGPALDDVNAADAYRRARPNDAEAALAVHSAVLERDLGDDSHAASLAVHAVRRAAELGADGNEPSRRALVLLGQEEVEPALRVRGHGLRLADAARDEQPLRAGTGAMLLALTDPITPDVVARLVYGSHGVVTFLQDLDEDLFDDPVDKAFAFA